MAAASVAYPLKQQKPHMHMANEFSRWPGTSLHIPQGSATPARKELQSTDTLIYTHVQFRSHKLDSTECVMHGQSDSESEHVCGSFAVPNNSVYVSSPRTVHRSSRLVARSPSFSCCEIDRKLMLDLFHPEADD
jgi:hypothetical protein